MYSCLAEAQKDKCKCTEGKFPVGGEICLNVTERKFFVYLKLVFSEHFNTLLETGEMMVYEIFRNEYVFIYWVGRPDGKIFVSKSWRTWLRYWARRGSCIKTESKIFPALFSGSNELSQCTFQHMTSEILKYWHFYSSSWNKKSQLLGNTTHYLISIFLKFKFTNRIHVRGKYDGTIQMRRDSFLRTSPLEPVQSFKLHTSHFIMVFY